MGKADQGTGTVLSFNEGLPKLDPRIIGADVAVLTFQELRRAVQTRVGEADVIVFKEYPQHGWYVNRTSLRRIALKYGNDYSKWMGQSIIIYVRDSAVPGTGQPTRTLWAANPEENALARESWDKLAKAAKAKK